jgi:hypothetical protein
MNPASIGQSRRVENADLCKKSSILITSLTADTYQYTVRTSKFVNAGRVGLTVAVRTTLLVAVVEDSEVVAINVLADKDIGDEF